ncbi:MAG: hypothetical protein HXX10_07590 [Rhodoplanes sp.]|uniref:hypothetical protein n=1 Tax=Rhodoplanes sp. TaxID=1968906 RepID=UPI0017ED92AF|nr:hypothetical protein [Rhodoplanes sp.]NVO13883.1 hypothetical protein [Rhodoplanes sp.]
MTSRKIRRAAARAPTYGEIVAEVERIAHRGKEPVATGQTIVRAYLAQAPIERLKRSGALDVWELSALDGLMHAYHTSIGQTAGHDAALGIVPTPRPDQADDSAARRVDVLRVYFRWRDDLKGRPEHVAARGVLFDERPLRAIERENHWRNGSATEHLRAAIRHFAALCGGAPRGRKWRIC